MDRKNTKKADFTGKKGQKRTSDGRNLTAEGRDATYGGQKPTVEGSAATYEGQTLTSDGQKLTVEGHVPTSEGRETTVDGRRLTMRGRGARSDGRVSSNDGRRMTSEGRVRACGVRGRTAPVGRQSAGGAAAADSRAIWRKQSLICGGGLPIVRRSLWGKGGQGGNSESFHHGPCPRVSVARNHFPSPAADGLR